MILGDTLTLSDLLTRDIPHFSNQWKVFVVFYRYYRSTPLNPSLKYMPKYSGTNYELRVGRTKIDEDKGEYIVKAENSYGHREESAFLNVERE